MSLGIPGSQTGGLSVPNDEDEKSAGRQRAPSDTSFLSAQSDQTLLAPPTPGGASMASSVTVGDADALAPDPGSEADFEVENNKFAFSPGQMNKLLNPKSLAAFTALGGLRGIERGLRTSIESGLSIDEGDLEGSVTFDEVAGSQQGKGDDNPSTLESAGGQPGSFSDRIRIFKRNVIPAKKATPLWKLMWMAYNDTVLLVLTGAAVISLSLGLYETFRTDSSSSEGGSDSGKDTKWVEGVAIICAILVVVIVGGLNDWQKERAFVKLNAKKEDREVKAIRSGTSTVINIYDVLVGDVIHLEPGDVVPADGIFISGHNVKCDESSATGESDSLKKTGGLQVSRLLEEGHSNPKNLDPFIISGAKVLEGVGTYLVTSVGVNSSFGKIMMSMRTESEETPLQVKLGKMAAAIAKLGTAAATLLFFVLLFRFLGQLDGDTRTGSEKASVFTDILITAITVIVVAIPEGLPLAVTLALAFGTTRLMKENNLVRILKACEVMGNATTVCSDKTGTLTTNKMAVVAGTFGKDEFDASTASTFSAKVPKDVKEMIVRSIAINSTAFEGVEDGVPTFIGSKTEMALLNFAKEHFAMDTLSNERANVEVVQLFPFDSNKKCMGAAIKHGNQYRLFVKGASEIVLEACSSIADVTTGAVSDISGAPKERITETINMYAQKSLRTIGLTYKDFPSWPPAGTQSAADPSAADFDPLFADMTFSGVVGIQDPVRPGVPEAVAKCQFAGVKVRMVTGDNVVTARAIAKECGIVSGHDENDIVMEGPEFRKLSDEAMTAMLPRLAVLARSSPQDKQILVQRLRAMNETVAVTGDGTNDGPALKAADVGFSMGIAGTEVAKEASAIILMDDNFASIVKALMWGRAVNDAVAKFLQFQLTVNVTAVTLTFVSAVESPTMESVLKAVQLLWVNLIMDVFAALALATDPPTEEILNRKPAGKKAPLITVNMWKMIIGQAIFQLAVTFTLYFAGASILSYDTSIPEKQLELNTVIFNTFVWMQIFNEFNNRRLDNRFNIFAGLQHNFFFIGINCIMVGAQIAIVYIGGEAFAITRIDGTQWAICLVLASFSWPMGVLIRLFPDPWFERVARLVMRPVILLFRSIRRVYRKLPSFRRKKTPDPEDVRGAEKQSIEALPPPPPPPAVLTAPEIKIDAEPTTEDKEDAPR
ncbi:calcium-translocating P-type ATPase [Drepanopeziza brunnea f. sp. 'multigermtubi' MB_m1]|uniref:Calcium-transporting ATPase n=1 Tax=Marssonina brunnea f. sp. multigermtubi (strain MB_m1) TaxID=1072389 RepID=K1WJ72_MARBU|nr:calcium-translocating P-type ATPase [Drepanopeziza brunnea f. sp. 'multigermtubi' MB_m1]EKD12242.1 calcium-translocating P-type ATPase [Drepanopeziza brunnea f. sp. 'multigermtubi' MB_m1]